MKRLIALLFILFPSVVFAGGIINVMNYGIVLNNCTYAQANTDAIKLAWNQAAREDGTGGELYFPAGRYCINEIGRITNGFNALKQTNIKGDGKYKSVLVLNQNQNTQLLRIANLFFNAKISDLGFEGNKDTNASTDHLIYIAGYDYVIDNLFILNSGGNGIFLQEGQHIRLEMIESQHNVGWGIVSGATMNMNMDSVSSEYNGLGGIKLQATSANGVRASTPAISLDGIYLEGEPIGLLLEGISGITARNISSHSNTPISIQITKDPVTGMASTGNTIYPQRASQVVIESGNHSNTIIVTPNTKYTAVLVDNDGRNKIGSLVKEWSEIPKENSVCVTGEINTTSNYYRNITVPTTGEYQIDTMLKIPGSCKAQISLLDMTGTGLYYDWDKKTWSANLNDMRAAMYIRFITILNSGDIQAYRLPIVAGPATIREYVSVSNCTGKTYKVDCIKLVE